MEKIIGLGGCGSNVINYLIEHNLFDECERITVNENISVSKHSKAEKNILLHCDMDTAIVEVLHNCTRLCVISGLGGNTGVKYLTTLASICQKAKIDVHYIVVTPFKIEGKIKQDLSTSTLKTLISISSNIEVIDNEKYLPTKPKEQRLISDIFSSSNEEIAQTIEKKFSHE